MPLFIVAYSSLYKEPKTLSHLHFFRSSNIFHSPFTYTTEPQQTTITKDSNQTIIIIMSATQFSDVSSAFDAHWQQDTVALSKIQTVRLDNGQVNPNILQCRDYIFNAVSSFNEEQETLTFRPFQWCKTGGTENSAPSDDDILAADFTVFGLRFGSDAEEPAYKMVVICHLDTVPADPDSTVWDPYNPIVEQRHYPGGTVSDQDFLVGRGCVDDKGPAASLLVAARCVARAMDGSNLDNVQVELLFDASEEWNMSAPHYFEGEGNVLPDFGIVYDAFWNVRAEKGIERPTFWIDNTSPQNNLQSGIYVASLVSAGENSTNTIPDYCDAVFKGDDPAAVRTLADSFQTLYKDAVFDDENYNKAEMDAPIVAEDGLSFSVRTHVAGAQHGSAPEQNRQIGANPLVSLANFVNWLVIAKEVTVTNNVSTLASFISSTWGTKVFGEAHESLYKYDEVFTDGNGTTYAVTKTVMDEGEAGRITLTLDIRYAIGHHQGEWDGVTEGFLPRKNSTFSTVFGDLVQSFNEKHPELNDVCFETETIYAPDIRVPDTNEFYQSVESSFEKVMGYKPDRFAIGGGTDAKGYTFLCGAGPLFNPSMGHPINYHGLNEAAPIADMKKSTEILYQAIMDQVQTPSTETGRKKRNLKVLQFLRKLHDEHGLKMKCSC